MAKKKSGLTSDNIKKVQIIATLDDGTHLMAVSEDKFLIKTAVVTCKFAKLRDDLFTECSLKELMD